MKNTFIFWQRWLLYSSLFLALFGLVLCTDGNGFLFVRYAHELSGIFFHQQQFPPEVKSFWAFMCAPTGATIACCYILLAFMAAYPFKRKEVWARNAIVVAFGLWFIFDSIGCWYSKVYFQVYLVNAVSLLQKLLPIVFTWKDFKSSEGKS